MEPCGLEFLKIGVPGPSLSEGFYHSGSLFSGPDLWNLQPSWTPKACRIHIYIYIYICIHFLICLLVSLFVCFWLLLPQASAVGIGFWATFGGVGLVFYILLATR